MDIFDEYDFFRCFREISSVPRKTTDEAGISDHLKNYCQGLGLDTVQDPFGNVIARKGASAGREAAPSVVLQAHMDMVYEKSASSSHVYGRDPLPLIIEGDTLSTGGETTLGADNGIGAAYIMALLADSELQHPALEAVFTTREEEDFGGADGLAKDAVSGRMLINLDHGADHQIVCGSCGGTAMRFVIPGEREKIGGGQAVCKVTVGGLPGGHSGEDIDRGIASAVMLLGRLLDGLSSDFGARLMSISGGTNRSAIPRSAEMMIAVPDGGVCRAGDGELENAVKNFEKAVKREYGISCPGLYISAAKVDDVPEDAEAYTRGTAEKVVRALYLIPSGIIEMNGRFRGIVNSSNNIGTVRSCPESIELVNEIRAAYKSSLDEICRRIEIIAAMLGCSTEKFSGYPGWEFAEDSKLREIAAGVYRRMFSCDPEEVVLHAGIECGCLAEKYPGLEAISIGPNIHNMHSPSESLEISSAVRMYGYLKEILKAVGR